MIWPTHEFKSMIYLEHEHNGIMNIGYAHDVMLGKVRTIEQMIFIAG